ncbi:unnamed protein product [Rotaria sp. Silwood1]|nr:unnamed protein product [Rotaria sp. Silwood1]CAF3939218.1 unnamed protein product [Rotaria sp. Silwood1]CAF4843698.1 unnamed protein product [Rotaria sp. Silwood1]CAF5029254.1 unnamed protein product [Rotaria sp. Silwood1]
MSTVVITGLDSRTNVDTVENFCQTYGRILNCYIKSNQCIVTFADKHNAEEFIHASPHRINSTNFVNATWKTTFNRNSSYNQHSTVKTTTTTTTNSNSNNRLTIRGTSEQLEEKNLIRYFSHYGHVRMCLANSLQGFATITFDDRISYERALKESRHFLNGRSLIVEPYTSNDDIQTNKRIKLSDPSELTSSLLITKLEHEKEQLTNTQIHLENQYQEHIKLYEYEKFQWNEYIKKRENEFNQQIGHYQYLLQQSLDEIIKKDKQIEQLKKENKDIDDLLRQSVHDNEQQLIHIRKREEIHNQTKRKYEELYKAYIKLKDNCATQRNIEKDPIASTISIANKPKSTKDDVRKK